MISFFLGTFTGGGVNQAGLPLGNEECLFTGDLTLSSVGLAIRIVP